MSTLSRIYYTPSSDEILAIAKNNPEIEKSIKDKIILSLLESGFKLTKNKIEKQSKLHFDKIFNELEKNYFIKKSAYDSEKIFNPNLEKELKELLEKKYQEILNQEIDEYMNSIEFKKVLIAKIKEKSLSYALNYLDEEIKKETFKILEEGN